MLFNNGVAADMSFSQVLVTTRNPTIDAICAGAGLGGDNITGEMLGTELKFGELLGGEGHASFGVPGEIGALHSDYHAVGGQG
jgi:hypothetical protein